MSLQSKKLDKFNENSPFLRHSLTNKVVKNANAFLWKKFNYYLSNFGVRKTFSILSKGLKSIRCYIRTFKLWCYQPQCSKNASFWIKPKNYWTWFLPLICFNINCNKTIHSERYLYHQNINWLHNTSGVMLCFYKLLGNYYVVSKMFIKTRIILMSCF